MTSRLQAGLLAKRAMVQRLNANQQRGGMQAGFTLIELLITVVIIGVLSAIAIPNFISQQNNAKDAAAKAEASALARKCAAAVITGSGFPTPDEISAATNVTATGCTAGAGSFTGGGTTFAVGTDGSITQ
jgi:type IV pilus assembly protein PilA